MKKLLPILFILLIPSITLAAFPDGWTVVNRIPIPAVMAGHVVYINEDILGATSTDMFDADGSHPAKNGGGDLVFSTSNQPETAADGVIPCEVVSFVTDNDPANGTAEIYILPPEDYAPYVYVYYGNSSASQPASDSTNGSEAVWENYRYVSHDGGWTDSTGNTATATNVGSITVGGATGQLGVATDFSGTGQYFSIPDADILALGDGTTDVDHTFQAWIRPDVIASFYIMNKGGGLAESNNESEWGFEIASDSKFYHEVIDESATAFRGKVSSSVMTGTGTWAKYEGVWNAPYSYIYKNTTGITAVDLITGTYTAMENNDAVMTVGSTVYNGTAYCANGLIDEIRICGEVLSVAVRAAEYANETAPSTFTQASTPSIISSSDLYVGPASGGAGSGTIGDPWGGWDDVDWDDVGAWDTIHDTSGESYVVDEKDYSGLVTISGAGNLIDGSTTIDNDDWADQGSNIHRVEITANDFDYEQATEPASPTTGEKWFLTNDAWNIYGLSGHQGRAYEWTGTEWLECNFYRKPNQVWIDGVSAEEATTTAASSANTATTATAAAFGGHADDYWVGCVMEMFTRIWQKDRRIITASSGNVVTFESINFTPDTPAAVSIVGNIAELDVEGEWAYDSPYLYVYSTDPTAYTWEYSSGSSGILLRNCYGIKITGYSITKTNDCGILGSKNNDVIIDNNLVTKCAASTFFYFYGGIAMVGKSLDDIMAQTTALPSTTKLDYTSNSQKIEISRNRVNTMWGGGSAIFNIYNNRSNIHNNIIGGGSVESGAGAGIRSYRSEYSTVDSNQIRYTKYCGIQCNFNHYLTISNNFISHPMQSFTDGAGIYIAFWSNYNSITGNTIEYVPAKTNAAAVYIDNYASYNTASDNIVYKYDGINFAAFFEHAILLNGHNICTDNILYEDDTVDYVRFDNGTWYTGWTGTTSGNTQVAESTYPGSGSNDGKAMLLWFLQ